MIRTHKDNPMISILIRDRREDTEMGKRNVTTGVGSESSDVAGFENGGREP